MNAADGALIALGRDLRSSGYRFAAVTPATHGRVNARPENRWARSLTDVFGWSRPFRRGALPARVVALLEQAEALDLSAGADELRSKVRFSSLGEQLFVHSAFPTQTADAVFFGPDTYRFARALRSALVGFANGPHLRIVDLGCGSGAGGLHVASRLPPGVRAEIVLADINPRALRCSRINAVLNAVPDVSCVESDVFAAVDGAADLIVSNPPYLVDPLGRAYRHGGGAWGCDLSLRIVKESLGRLKPGGRMVLYTGAPVVSGVDEFFSALSPVLSCRRAAFTYEEIDPDVFGEELEHAPYARADRIAVIALTIDAPRTGKELAS